MTRKEFRDFIEQKMKDMLELYDRKNQEYGGDGTDTFHNFNDGYSLSTADSAEEFAWDLRCKHLQSIKDLITKRNNFTKEQVDEKFGDDILYGFIIWGIVQKYYQSVNYSRDWEDKMKDIPIPGRTVFGPPKNPFGRDPFGRDVILGPSENNPPKDLNMFINNPEHKFDPTAQHRLPADKLVNGE